MTVSVDRHLLTVNATTGRGVIARHGHESGRDEHARRRVRWAESP